LFFKEVSEGSLYIILSDTRKKIRLFSQFQSVNCLWKMTKKKWNVNCTLNWYAAWFSLNRVQFCTGPCIWTLFFHTRLIISSAVCVRLSVMMFLCVCCIWQAVCDRVFSLVALLNRWACYWLQLCRGRSLGSVLQTQTPPPLLILFDTKPQRHYWQSTNSSGVKIVISWINTI